MSSGSNSFGARRGANRKQVVVQNLGTMNIGAGEDAVQERMASASTTLFKPTGSFNGDDKAFYHIRQFQPLLAHKDALKAARRQSTMARNLGGMRVQPLASFNRYDHRNRSKEDIESDFVCIGFAYRPYVHGEPTQNDGGMAAIVTGSFSTVNTGNSIWFPGMPLKWEAYDMRSADEHALRTWEATHDRMGGFTVETPRGYVPPVLSEFDLNRDVRMWQINALKAELAAAANNPKDAQELLNFGVLEDPAALAKLSHRRVWVMRRLRGTALTMLRFNKVTADGIANAGFGYLLGQTMAPDVASTLARGFAIYLGLDSEDNFDDSVSPVVRKALNTMFSNAAFDVYNVTADAIAHAVQRVVGFSIDFALPGADGAIVI
jgi:hypothetical protein